MSVINQLLLDLEKRQGSGNAFPGEVRPLSEGKRGLRPGWFVVGGLVAAIVAAWMLLSGGDRTGERAATSSGSARDAEIAIEKAIAGAPGTGPIAKTDDEPRSMAASRLSLELSSPPAPEKRGDTDAPLATERVIRRAGTQAERAREAPVAPSRPIEFAKPPAAKAPAAVAPPKVAAVKPDIRREVRQPTARELAENEYRKATALLHQGNREEAQEGFQAALKRLPGHHGARQALVGMLLEAKKNAEAETVLEEGLAIAPSQSGFTMTLARLQLERGETNQAIDTLKKGIEYPPVSAEYLAFLAALLQRQGRHEEAIEQYRGALLLRPNAGVWWMGVGISQQALGRQVEAKDAYERARSGAGLSPALAAFVAQRLKELE